MHTQGRKSPRAGRTDPTPDDGPGRAPAPDRSVFDPTTDEIDADDRAHLLLAALLFVWLFVATAMGWL